MDTTTQAPLADPEWGILDDLVDLDRHPIDCPSDPRWVGLIERARSDLAERGSATLEQFLRPDAVASLVDEIAMIAQHVPVRRHAGTVYARAELEAGLSADDPRCVRQEWYAGHVTRDMFPPYSAAHRLYVAPGFKALIAAIVGQDRVYEYADPLAGLVATILPPGGRYPWHYDTNEYVVTIMIQAPESGGAFEYHRNLRTPGHENLDGLGDVLSGRSRRPPTTTVAAPGDLQVFLGRYSLHQVAEVGGSCPRHVLVLSYADRPGVIGPVDRTRSVYGRITEAHLLAEQIRLAENDGLIL